MEAILFLKDMAKKHRHWVVSSTPFTTKGDLSCKQSEIHCWRLCLPLISDSRKNGFMGSHETEMRKSEGSYSLFPDYCKISWWHWQVTWPLVSVSASSGDHHSSVLVEQFRLLEGEGRIAPLPGSVVGLSLQQLQETIWEFVFLLRIKTAKSQSFFFFFMHCTLF